LVGSSKVEDARAGAAPVVWWVWPLVATLIMQTTAAFLSRLVPTLAPALMDEFGWSEPTIGYVASLGTVGSILFLFAGAPLIRRAGPIRALEIGIGVGIIGLAALAMPFGVAVLFGSLLIGFGYGPSTPAGAEVLQRHAPARHRNVVFSIKQAGVPIGGVLAGLALPGIAEWGGWRAALVFAALISAATIALVEPLRERIDTERDRGLRLRLRLFLSVENLRRPLASLKGEPDLQRMAFVGACFAIGQGTWMTFLVTYLVARLGLTLPQAGFVFAVMQMTGIVGRLVLGWVSDRIGSGVLTLRVVAVASAATSVSLALTTPAWSLGALAVLAAIGGVTVSSWNGVQIAEVAGRSPPGHIADASAGATILIFLGYVIGPSAFALLVAATGRFDLAFHAVALVTAAALAALAGFDKPRASENAA
jgi:MFS family permease